MRSLKCTYEKESEFPMRTNTAASLQHTETRSFSVAREVMLIGGGTLFLTACSQIAFPFWPAPFTMQTFAVILIAGCFGLRRGTATVSAYVAAGCLGLPVFANFSGVAALFGPTTGYILGFVAAAAITGALMDAGFRRHWTLSALAMTAGTAAILYGGTCWLAVAWGMGWQTAASAQLIYLPGAIVKIALAMAALPYARKLLR